MPVARRLVVRGRVQGVGFRYFVETSARSAGVAGWVRNRADGGVEAHLEGDADAVARVEARLGQGPPLARVEAVEGTDVEPDGRFDGFVIRG